MRRTYSCGITSVFGDGLRYCTVTPAANKLNKSIRFAFLACFALVLATLAGCSGVAVTANSAGTTGTVSGATPPPPVVNGAPATSAEVGVLYDYIPDVSDALGHALTFQITNMPAWATFSTTSGELKGTPAAADVGTTAEIEIGVSDGAGQATIGPFRITITAAQSTPPPTQAPPIISGTPPASAAVGQVYSFTPSASDPSGGTLSFLIVNRPAWASFNTTTGEFSGKPTAQNVGSFANIAISVSNGTSTASLPAFTVTVSVLPGDAKPTINGVPTTAVNAGSTYSFTPTASDPNGLALTFSVQNQPSWASFNTTTGQLAGTPAAADVGSFANVVISVSNGTASASLAAFTITVSAAAVDQPPVISGTPATSVTAGSAYSFTPLANDPAGQPLTFSIKNQPSWANFNTATGRLFGTPTASNVGSFANVIITVSDGTASASLPAFTVTVSAQPVDGPPTISGSPATSVTAGSAYSFTPTATDPQGHALTFSIGNRPPWANFNTSTGQLSGTPSAGNVGSFANITISVSNGASSASLAAFTITVLAPNDGPPKISGSPPTSVNAGSPYSFTPTASDPQGHALVFSIANPPPWASFNTSTGQLSGTPTAANVGSFANVNISVSNGTASASLPAFTINVTQISTGTATISWTTPTKNTNGTPLVNLAGFTVYYGTSTSNLGQTVQIANPGVNTYLVDNLAPGTWYFAVSDYTSSGAQSNLSNIGSKTIQ
jgi:hypothetical protein